jgi:hypothetical protein
MPRRISAAMITKVIYHPSIATTKRIAPPACEKVVSTVTMINGGQGSTYNLKVTSCSVIASSNVEVSASKNVNSNSGKAKDTSKDSIGLERKDKVGDESKAPDDKVESNGIVVVRACGTLGSIASGRVRSSNAERGKLDHTEGKPEDTEERERVHL